MRRTEKAEGPLTGVLRAYQRARGDQGDQKWAEEVVGVLVLDNVSAEVIRSELEKALPLVRDSGEAPESLYGPARAWARERMDQRVDEGLPTIDSSPDSSWRDVPIVGSVVACFITVLMTVILLVRDGWSVDYTWGMLLLPIIGGVGVMAALTTWESVLTRRSRTAAALCGLAVLVPLVVVLTSVLWGTREHVIVSGSTFRMLLLAVGYALLAGLLERFLPQRDARRHAPLDDPAWERRLAGTLRLRMDMSERQVHDIVQEAKAHVARSGRGLEQEFGRPDSYASRFAPDRPARARRAAWGLTALLALTVVLAVGGMLEDPGWSGVSWFGVLLTLVLSVLALRAWREARRLQRQASSDRLSGTTVGAAR